MEPYRKSGQINSDYRRGHPAQTIPVSALLRASPSDMDQQAKSQSCRADQTRPQEGNTRKLQAPKETQ